MTILQQQFVNLIN